MARLGLANVGDAVAQLPQNPAFVTAANVGFGTFNGAEGSFVEVFGAINSLFDRNPPVAPGGNGYPTNPVYFDTYGATWKAGVRVQF